jgi:hypothetical protein
MKRNNSDNSGEVSVQPDGAGDLSAKQELALRAIISHPTLKDAAAAAGVSETTLWRYKQDPKFSRRLREVRREAVEQTRLCIEQGAGDAVTVLHDLMMNQETPAAARVSAVKTFLDYSMRGVEMDELRQQVEDLAEFIRVKQEQDARNALLKEYE